MSEIKRNVEGIKYHIRKRVLIFLHKFTRNRIYTVRHGLATGLKRKGGLGFLPASLYTGPKEKEGAFLESLSFDGMTVFDVGGYQGVFTLFFARAVGPGGKVVTFEPNPRSFALLQENVTLNGFSNVQVHNLGVGRENGKMEFTYDPMDPGEGSFNEYFSERNLATGRAKQATFEVVSLDDCVYKGGFSVPQFIKIDVEGFEKEVLLGASKLLAEHKPKLFIEMHGVEGHEEVFLTQTEQIISMLLNHGYIIRRIETGEQITARNFQGASEGRIYCT